MTAESLRFGACELRPSTRELLVDGAPARVGERGFELLLALVEARGAVVSRDALFERAWRGVVVGDENLKVQVMALRKVIGAQAIVTVPGRGYRLGVPVQVEHANAAPVQAGEPVDAGLIGRDAEMQRLQGLLRGGALVTLVGPGGVGKTRLATAAARAARGRFSDGVRIIELASLSDPSLLPDTVARALDLPVFGAPPSAEHVARVAAPLSLLVVLDNCEHLLDAATAMAGALHALAPRIALLATSQRPFGLGDEQVLRLQGLDVAADNGTADASDAASALFIARARQADQALVLDAPTRAAVAAISRRLDGLPLAIELAAARTPLLGVQGVLERLGQTLPLLAGGARDRPPRQQTMRAALQWSHALLSPREQRLLRRLGAFVDSFSIEAAQAVDGEGDLWSVTDTLGALVDKSLLQAVDVRGQRRLRLLVGARDFALERLAEAGEEVASRDRLARHLVAHFEAAEERFFGAPRQPWLDALWPEANDLRATLRWLSRPDGDRALLVALVGAAGGFWGSACLTSEALHWIGVARPFVDEHTPTLRAAHFWQALAVWAMEPTVPVAEPIAAAARAQALYREAGHASGEYRMLALRVQQARRAEPQLDVMPLLERMSALEAPHWTETHRWVRRRAEAVLQARRGDWAGYRDRFALEAAQFAEAGDTDRYEGALFHVALAEIALGTPRRAVEVLEPVVEELRRRDRLRVEWTRPAILLVARIECGDGAAAANSVLEVLTLLRVAEKPSYISAHLAWWAAQCGAPEQAARLLGWADAYYEREPDQRNPHSDAGHARALALLKSQLDPARIDALRRDGRALGDEMALQLVRQVAERAAVA